MLPKLVIVGLIAAYFLETRGISSESPVDLEKLLLEIYDNKPSNEAGKPCHDSLGVCVNRLLCKTETSLHHGDGFLNIRLGEECQDTFEVCCDRDDVLSEATSQLPIVVPEKQRCGVRNQDGVGFKIEGNTNESEFGEFPWIVAMVTEYFLPEQIVHVYECSGSLIHPSVVLTAAHCVHEKNVRDMRVRLGEWDSNTDNEPLKHIDHAIQSVAIHPHFYRGALLNGIALVFLKTPVKLFAHISTICLPPQNKVFDHSRCFASGWGKHEFGQKGKYQAILKKIELPVMPRLQCEEVLKTTRLNSSFSLHNSFICAGGEEGKDMCTGDGGGPLVCPILGSSDCFYQAGIVSWGIGCGAGGIPGVYVNVAGFRDWIESQITAKGFGT